MHVKYILWQNDYMLQSLDPLAMESGMNLEEPPHAKATLETVTQVRRWTDSLLTFQITRPRDYRFKPGQFSRLGLESDGSMIWRAYSVTSSPAQDYLEYVSVVVPGGAFTTMLTRIVVGAPIWIEKQEYGFMTVDRFQDGDVLWMLATGTGIGPYVSMLRDPEVWQKFRRIVLVHGVKYANELSYHEVLFDLKSHPPLADAAPAELHLIETSTRESEHSPGRLHGRITTLLDDGTLEKAARISINVESSRIMMCGNPAMIEDTRRILHGRGLRPCRRLLPGQFVTENYW